MAQFDNPIPKNPDQQFQRDRVGNLEYFLTQLQSDKQRLVEEVRVLSDNQRQPIHYYAPGNLTAADLHLPPPALFNGAATALPDFQIKLHNFFSVSPGLYDTALNKFSTLEISWQTRPPSGTAPRLIPPLFIFPHPGT